MSYYTGTEFSNFVSLNATSDLPDATEAARVTLISEQSDAECDAYLAAVISVPMATATGIIKLCSLKIGYYYLIGMYPYASQQDRERAKEYHDQAIATLEKIATGELPVGDAGAATPSARMSTNAANLRKISTVTNPDGEGTANQYAFSPDQNE